MWPMVGGVLIPTGIIILFDLAIFTRVMWVLSKGFEARQETLKRHEKHLQRLRRAFAIIVLLGLTWICGYLTTIQTPGDDNVEFAFDIIFIILNSLQGFFLFIFYCLRNPKARASWVRLVKRCLPSKKEKASSSSDKQPSSQTKTQSPSSEGSIITVITKHSTSDAQENSAFDETDEGDQESFPMTTQGPFSTIPRAALRR